MQIYFDAFVFRELFPIIDAALKHSSDRNCFPGEIDRAPLGKPRAATTGRNELREKAYEMVSSQ